MALATASSSSSETRNARCRSPSRGGNISTEACTRPWMRALVQASRRDSCCQTRKVLLLRGAARHPCGVGGSVGLGPEADFHDLIFAGALGAAQDHRVPLFPPDEGPGDRGRDGQAVQFDVRLAVPDDGVGGLVAGLGL